MIAKQKLQATLLALLETTPLEQISVSMLTKSAGIGRSSSYYYYDSVFDLVDEMEEDFIRGIGTESTVSSRIIRMAHEGDVQSRNDIYNTLSYVQKNLTMFRLLSGPNGDPAFQDKLRSRMLNISRVMYSVTDLSDDQIDVFVEAAAAQQ